MDKDLTLIKDLQNFDSIIIKEKRLLKKNPQIILEYERHYKEAEKELELKRDVVEKAQKNRREYEASLDDATARLDKLKSQMSEIKTNKEYQARLKEIEKLEEERSLIEDKILIAMEEIDEIEKLLLQVEEKLKEEEKKFNKKKAIIEREQAEAKERLKELINKRNEISKNIEPEIYNQYMFLMEKKSALAVVSARDETCMGCNMKIPPQTFAEVIKGERIITCPQCNRFLHFEPESVTEKV